MSNILNGEVIDLFEVRCDAAGYSIGFFTSEHKAEQTAKIKGKVRKRKAIMFEKEGVKEWQFYLLESVSVDTDYDEAAIKQSALSKLTEEEKRILELDE